ncbi:hypothetical protein [Thermoactinomyces sp. DSM 45892]|uniref:hypothetical protein n=1 Tax=Thermoactinomyces sp. DSM 45892 TaxID=1882753 RepID=UPI00089A0889|nr:hypothetical protein [Thermoactinomyces sp. DSM 45892]SDY22114.1 hypothetical protein SAMN05444416_10316 [Thermoactinomyces sp. DSM 45892]
MKRLVLCSVLLVSLVGCSSEKSAQPQPQKPPQAQVEASTIPKAEKLPDKQLIEKIKAEIGGRPFVDNVKIENNTLTITYKEDKKDLKLYNEYWGTGDAITKNLMSNPPRYLRVSDSFNKVHIEVPFQGKKYTVTITRTEVEHYFGVKLSEVTENNAWISKIIDPFVYNKEKRAEYAKQFIKITP